MNFEKSIELTDDHSIEQARIATLISGIKLEAEGLRKRGRSCLSIAKSHYGVKGNRQNIIKQLTAMIRPFETYSYVFDNIAIDENCVLNLRIVWTVDNLTDHLEIESVDVQQVSTTCLMDGIDEVFLKTISDKPLIQAINVLAENFVANNLDYFCFKQAALKGGK